MKKIAKNHFMHQTEPLDQALTERQTSLITHESYTRME